VAMRAGLVNLQKLTKEAYATLEENTKNIVALLQDWMDKNGFADYQIIQYGSLFYPINTKDKLTNITQLPSNMGERFKALFEVLLNKGIYLAPNGYEVGFVSLAHDKSVQEELKKRLWN
jgi:glutamate-1-semialdehyde 2,1-aminomutase